MQSALLVIGIGLLIGIIYLTHKISNLQESKDDKLMLEYIEALRKEVRESGSENRKETQNRLDLIDERLAKGLKHSSASLQKQFEQSSSLIQKVTKKLTELDDTNKQVLDFSKQMQNLENILKNKNQRGVIGEYFLETLLSEVLTSDQYKMQYQFKNREIVDAAIFFRSKVIPIDAKFPLSTYEKLDKEKDPDKLAQLEKAFRTDVKNRIDETSKYIRPEEATTSFAFMFIPAEGVYYKILELSSSQKLHEYAFSKNVTIVSPISFFAYLQTVLDGIKALKMEESLKDIIKNIGNLSKHMGSYETYFQKVGNNLGTTVNMYNNAYKEFKKIDKDVYKLTDGQSGGQIEPVLIDKPNID